MMMTNKIPIATYRIQFSPQFGFQKAKAIVPYLKKLGISHLYASPIFRAVPGSTHGYDVVDPTQLNPELGTQEDFLSLIAALKDVEIGWIQDIVPNHMAYHHENKWLMDVLENGKQSEFNAVFDIEWKDTYRTLQGKVLAPFLGRFYHQCLIDQEIQLEYEKGSLNICYYETKLPLKIETYADVLSFKITELKEIFGAGSDLLKTYKKLIRSFQEVSEMSKGERAKKVKECKSKLSELVERESAVRHFIEKNRKRFNGEKGVEESFCLLDYLISKQLFQLTFWKFGMEEINYRRFFNINQLISVRVEKQKVFERTHSLISEYIQKGYFSGLRVDHIDGLLDPRQYLERLRSLIGGRYLIVEKILQEHERLPAEWPVEGTTGYEFMDWTNKMFVEKKNKKVFDRIYQQVAGSKISFSDLVTSKKRLIVGKNMAGDIDNLAHHMKRISRKDTFGRDITLYGLKRAIVEVMVCFSRYRTYIDESSIREEDRRVILQAIELAKRNNPELVYELEFIKGILLLKFSSDTTDKETDRWLHFVRRFQQFSGPLMAKGFEDTALYVFNRLISLNEVGSHPDCFGISTASFHRFQQSRLAHASCALNATATHDTKRGEDVRARINVLSELPKEWRAHVLTWQKMNLDKKEVLEGQRVPDQNDEYFLYQTMVGGLPFEKEGTKSFRKRLKEYLIKAVREAKVHTAWIQPDTDYEKAFLRFIDRLFDPEISNSFLDSFYRFQKKVQFFGSFHSYSQLILKMTTPGVPDIYQGRELWDLSFVDPDNRRPVDYRLRKKRLREMEEGFQKNPNDLINKIFDSTSDGSVKLFLIWRILFLRNLYPQVFKQGSYKPLSVEGKFKNNILAFSRSYQSKEIIVIVPRFLTQVTSFGKKPLGKVWEDTVVNFPMKGTYQNVITGEKVSGQKINIKDIYRIFPGGVLRNETK